MAVTRKKLGATAQAAALFVMSSVGAERGALAAERLVSTELEQATINMLDTAAVSTAMTSFVQRELLTRGRQQKSNGCFLASTAESRVG
jgi:hypothetical protein